MASADRPRSATRRRRHSDSATPSSPATTTASRPVPATKWQFVPPCGAACFPACALCRDRSQRNPRLWRPLAVAEVVVPSHVLQDLRADAAGRRSVAIRNRGAAARMVGSWDDNDHRKEVNLTDEDRDDADQEEEVNRKQDANRKDESWGDTGQKEEVNRKQDADRKDECWYDIYPEPDAHWIRESFGDTDGNYANWKQGAYWRDLDRKNGEEWNGTDRKWDADRNQNSVSRVDAAGEDIVDSIALRDPRDPTRTLLTTRVHAVGRHLVLGYDDCYSAGLLLRAHFVVKLPGGRALRSGVRTSTTTKRFEFPLGDVLRGGGARSLLHFEHRGHALTVKFFLEVSERWPVPRAVLEASAGRPPPDVRFRVAGVEVLAHRAVLAACSDSFRRLASKAVRHEVRIAVKDGPSAEAFAKFVDFLYADAGRAAWADCELDLLALARGYKVWHLRALCEARLWALGGARALAALVRASRQPWLRRGLLATPDLHDRLCDQVAFELDALRHAPDWHALQAEGGRHTALLIERIASKDTILVRKSACFVLDDSSF